MFLLYVECFSSYSAHRAFTSAVSSPDIDDLKWNALFRDQQDSFGAFLFQSLKAIGTSVNSHFHIETCCCSSVWYDKSRAGLFRQTGCHLSLPELPPIFQGTPGNSTRQHERVQLFCVGCVCDCMMSRALQDYTLCQMGRQLCQSPSPRFTCSRQGKLPCQQLDSGGHSPSVCCRRPPHSLSRRWQGLAYDARRAAQSCHV